MTKLKFDFGKDGSLVIKNSNINDRSSFIQNLIEYSNTDVITINMMYINGIIPSDFYKLLKIVEHSNKIEDYNINNVEALVKLINMFQFLGMQDDYEKSILQLVCILESNDFQDLKNMNSFYKKNIESDFSKICMEKTRPFFNV